jgi:hypothetical protein
MTMPSNRQINKTPLLGANAIGISPQWVEAEASATGKLKIPMGGMTRLSVASSQVDGIVSTLGVLSILFRVINVVLFAVRFVRRVCRKVREPAFGLMGKKVFLLWTWSVFILLLGTMLAATVLLVLTGNIWLSLSTLAFGSGIAVFVWLIWAIVPAIDESMRKSLEP